MRKFTLGLVLILALLMGFSSCIVSETQQEPDMDKNMADEMLNSVMDYIRTNHPDATPFIKENMSWTQSSSIKRVGYTEATYNSDGWTVTIGHTVTVEVIYEIRAEYHDGEIVWTGTVQNSTITEESYTRK